MTRQQLQQQQQQQAKLTARQLSCSSSPRAAALLLLLLSGTTFVAVTATGPGEQQLAGGTSLQRQLSDEDHVDTAVAAHQGLPTARHLLQDGGSVAITEYPAVTPITTPRDAPTVSFAAPPLPRSLPPVTTTRTTAPISAPSPPPAYFMNISTLLAGQAEYSTYLQHVEKYNIGAEITSSGNALTVFAPTNDAFDALPADDDSYLTGQNSYSYVLRYMILTSYFSFSELKGLGDTTLNSKAGPFLSIYGSDSGVSLGNGAPQATVSAPDVVLNGHLSVQGVNKVLLPDGVVPPSASPPPVVSAAPPQVLAVTPSSTADPPTGSTAVFPPPPGPAAPAPVSSAAAPGPVAALSPPPPPSTPGAAVPSSIPAQLVPLLAPSLFSPPPPSTPSAAAPLGSAGLALGPAAVLASASRVWSLSYRLQSVLSLLMTPLAVGLVALAL